MELFLTHFLFSAVSSASHYPLFPAPAPRSPWSVSPFFQLQQDYGCPPRSHPDTSPGRHSQFQVISVLLPSVQRTKSQQWEGMNYYWYTQQHGWTRKNYAESQETNRARTAERSSTKFYGTHLERNSVVAWGWEKTKGQEEPVGWWICSLALWWWLRRYTVKSKLSKLSLEGRVVHCRSFIFNTAVKTKYCHLDAPSLKYEDLPNQNVPNFSFCCFYHLSTLLQDK